MTFFVLAFNTDPKTAEHLVADLLARPGAKLHDVRHVLVDAGLPSDAVSLYRRVKAQIDAVVGSVPSLFSQHCFVLLDRVRFTDLDPQQEGSGGWEAAVAMLLLTYPEFMWHFAAGSSASGFPDSMQRKFDPFERAFLFDADGRRDSVRRRIQSAGRPVALRSGRAAVIDEEEDFATFHAYVAYRCGYRAEVITTWAAMRRHLGSNAKGYDLLLEDMSLRFPDRPAGMHIAQLETREKSFPALKLRGDDPLPRRWLITTGQTARDLPGVLDQNRAHIRAWAERLGGKGSDIAKPVAGIYDLIAKAGLSPLSFAPLQRGTAASPVGSEHGAPGKLGLVARALIERARAARDARPSVEAALFAAVCALDALELTAGESPTLALDALSLRHECEVIAECAFAGLQHRIKVNERFQDLKASLEQLKCHFSPDSAELVRISAEISIVTRVMRVFRDYARFSEEMECLNQIRDLDLDLLKLRLKMWCQRRSKSLDPFLMKLHPEWMTSKSRILSLLVAPQWWPHWYFKTLIRSPANFITLIFAWIVLLAVIFYLSGPPPVLAKAAPAGPAAVSSQDMVQAEADAVGCAAMDSITTFFGMGSPIHSKSCETLYENPREPWHSLSVAFAIIMGAIHLGIFISYIYTILSRR